MSRVLVTGGAGLIGAAVCRRLSDREEVTATFLQTSPPDLGAEIDWRKVDLRGAGALDGVEADAVVHCAAAIPITFDAADAVARTNRAIDATVLRMTRRTGASLVYASSTSLYGDAEPDGPGFAETAPIVADSPYQAEKAWAESQGRELARQTGSRFTALRINAPFGPRQRTRTVMMHFLSEASAGRPLRYYGEGTREQDFTYVDDIAAAVDAALWGPDGVYNVSGGEPVTMRNLAEIIAELAGLGPGLVVPAGVRDPQEARRARFDTSAARRALDWSPQTALRDGIAQCLRTVAGSS
jgi:nucleoside-diphosphate-sugar epimerase